MRIRLLLALWVLTAAASAGSIDDARDRIRNGTVGEATQAIETLVSADSADAVKALQQGVETILRRTKREEDDYKKKTKDLVDFQDTIIDIASKISEMTVSPKFGSPEYKALVRKRDQAQEKNKKLKEEQAAAKAKVMTSAEILAAALPAFGRFRSDGAVAVIERIAAAKSGRLSRACTWALVRIGAARSQPVLADVSRATDPALRALAARGLKAGEGGPPPELAQCLADKAWPVRYAAYDAAALAPLPVAIPLLIAAREKAKEDGPRIDLLLQRLTGVAPAEPPPWNDWWTTNAGAVTSGTFQRAPAPPTPPEKPAPEAIRSSRRLALVLASDPYVEPAADAEKGKEPDTFEPARLGLKVTVAAVPDGTTFGIVVAGYVPPQAKAAARASDATRFSAQEWLDKLEAPPRAPTLRVLTALLLTDTDDVAYADTVLFVSASRRRAEAEAVSLLAAQIGEMPAAPVVHCVGVGDSFDEDLLACVALQTGGAFQGGERRLHAKVPAPGADRWTAGTVRVAAYRALKSGEGVRDALTALASIGEEAYPLLPMLYDCLGSDQPDDVRAEALLVLGAMGPWARDALLRVEKLTGDGSQVVADAARSALERISAK